MNERIRLLAEQAGFQYIKDEGIGWAGNYNASLPKFAELILRDCTIILMTPENTTKALPKELAEYNRGWVNGRNLASKRIKEYFGIKEIPERATEKGKVK